MCAGVRRLRQTESVLLDDASNFTGEKNAGPNANSLRGYEVIDAIKAQVEASCKATVSCADIVALAARDTVSLLGGPSWTVQLGRRDGLSANLNAANSNLPPPDATLADLLARFSAKGLDVRDVAALSGAHTVGWARCATFRKHIYNDTGASAVDGAFATQVRGKACPSAAGDGNLAPLELRAPAAFDNGYFQDLVARRVLLRSDQELYGSGTGDGATDALVRAYAANASLFAADFAATMVRLGRLALTGKSGEGCDASILPDDTASFTGEKSAGPNTNSLHGYEVIEAIKAQVEASCKATVSCAGIVALAARDAVSLLRGLSWTVQLGRWDGLSANLNVVNANLPLLDATLADLLARFSAKGLDARDLTALSDAHTVGWAQCATFRNHIYNDSSASAVDDAFTVQVRGKACPSAGGDGNVVLLELRAPIAFDNGYFQGLVACRV
ncbi:hypothetical protein ACQ4PT_007108 [Festuca glaucescens]